MGGVIIMNKVELAAGVLQRAVEAIHITHCSLRQVDDSQWYIAPLRQKKPRRNKE